MQTRTAIPTIVPFTNTASRLDKTYRLAAALRTVVQRLDKARDAYTCDSADCEDRLCETCEQLLMLVDQAEILENRVRAEAIAMDNFANGMPDSDTAA